MDVQVGPSDPTKSDKDSNSTTLKVKCYGRETAHKIEHCPDFINKSIRQRIVFAGYNTLLVSASQPLSVNIVNNHIISYCTNQTRIKREHWRTLRKAQVLVSKQM